MRRGYVLPALGLIAVFAVVFMLTSSGADDAYRVRVELKDAAGLQKNYDVRSLGIQAGHVEDIEITRNDTAIATLELDKGAAPIGAGARADVRDANLLGEKYLEIDRGDLRRPAPSGALIPVTRTSTSVQLDDVLNALTPDVRARLRLLINEAGIAWGGRGQDFNGLLRELPGSLGAVRAVAEDLEAENARLGDLIDSADEALAPLAKRRRELAAVVTGAQGIVSATAEKREGLAQTLRAAAPALHQLTSTLGELDTTAERLTPAAAALGQTAPLLAATLEKLPATADALHEPLGEARAVAPKLRSLGVIGAPTVRRLRPTVRLLEQVATPGRSVTASLGRAGGADGLIGILENWSKTAGEHDGFSHFFNLRAVVGRSTFDSAIDRLMAANKGRRRAPGRSRPSTQDGRPQTAAPAPALPLPEVKVPPLKLLPQIKLPQLELPLPTTSRPNADGAQDTGLNDLLDFMLGP